MNAKTKILIVEHDPSDLELLQYELKKSGIDFVSEIVQNKPDYYSALKNFLPDIILCDYSLPAFDGPSAFNIREEIAPDTPFIFVSGTIGEENSIEYIRKGATDYALKDKLFTLAIKVKRALKEAKGKQLKNKTEQELILSEKRLARAQQVAQMGSWELDFATKVVMCSVEACRIYGFKPDQNQQKFETWLSFIHPDDLEYVLKINNEARRTLSGSNLNHRIILEDGTVKYIYTESKFEFDQNLQPIGLYGIVQDVTERKIADDHLIKSESSLNEAQAIAFVGSWEIIWLNNINTWSDGMYKIFGINKGEAEPSKELFLSFIHPDDLKYAKRRVEEAFTKHQNSSFDFRLIRKDGMVRHGYSEWKFEFSQNRKPIRLFGIVQDVTERKLAEAERIKMVSDLMLRNKDLEQFAYIVSHNLRAPVANIIGATSMLNNPGLSTEEKRILKRGVDESVKGLDNVLKDLSHILQVKGAINEIKESVRFSTLVDEIKISINNLIDKDDVTIKYNFSTLDEMFTLKSYLYSVFYNLISNSIKYRRQVPCIIEIKSQLIKNKVELIFTDNGMGIDLQKRGDQVFGLYKRFHANIEGKGMGLFMVKTQVETLGGKISVKSKVNKGTEFKIEFEL